MHDAGMSIRDLAAELGIQPLIVEKAFRMFTIAQVAATDAKRLATVLGCSAATAYSIVAYAEIKTGAKSSVGTRDEPPQDSVAALYALIGKAVVAWTVAKLTGAHLVQVGSTHVWVQLTGLDLQMSWTRPLGSTTKILVSDPASLYVFLKEAGDQYWFLSAAGVLQALIDYAEAYHTVD